MVARLGPAVRGWVVGQRWDWEWVRLWFVSEWVGLWFVRVVLVSWRDDRQRRVWAEMKFGIEILGFITIYIYILGYFSNYIYNRVELGPGSSRVFIKTRTWFGFFKKKKNKKNPNPTLFLTGPNKTRSIRDRARPSTHGSGRNCHP